MRNVSDKNCRENQNLFHVQGLSFISEYRAVYDVTCKNTVERDRQHHTAHALCMLDTYGYKHTQNM